MSRTTPIYQLPYPEETDRADVPVDMLALVNRLEVVLGNTGVPTGGCIDWFADTPPPGFLLCDGSAVSRTTYAGLFSVLSTKYGAGNGTTTFNLPDTRGRVSVGVATGGHADVATLGLNDGNALATRRPRHAHTVNESAHGHTVSDPPHYHGVTDQGHNHQVNDPWHVHSIGAGPNGQPVGGSSVDWQNGYGPTNTNAGPTNIWLSPAGTGITINGSATGVGVVANKTFLSVGVASGGTDTPSYVVVAKVIKA